MRDPGFDSRLDQIRRAAVEDAREALRTYAKKNGVDIDVDDMDADEVLDAAVEAGLIERDVLEEEYIGRHPEIDPDNENPPKGLDTVPAEEASNLDLYLERVDANVVAASGLDPDSPLDPATQADHVVARTYAEERAKAVELVEGRTDVDNADDLTDEQLRELTEEEAIKELLGEGDNPLPLATVVEHAKGDAIGTLTNEHGVPREELDGLDLSELTSRLADERAADANAAETESPAAPPAAQAPSSDVGPIETESVGPAQNAPGPVEDAGDGDQTPSTSTASGPAGNQPATDQPSGDQPASNDAPSGSTDAGASETVNIVYTITKNNSVHRSDEGRWFDQNGNEVVDPGVIDVLERGYDKYLGAGGQTTGAGTVDTLETTGNSTDEAAADADVSSGGESADGDESGDESDDDDDDDDDSDEGATSEDEESTDDGEAEGNEDDEGEGDAGGDEGTPTPDGAVAIDPEDQARFDESPFGAGQRQDQVDAIDARGSVAGSPDDDPSDADVADFLNSPAGAEAAETLADGVEYRAKGGDTDPDDLESEESGDTVIDGKLDGGGLADPTEDEAPATSPRFGSGSPTDPLGGPPIIDGPGGGDRFDDDGGPDDPTDPDGLLSYEAAPHVELDVDDTPDAVFDIDAVVVEADVDDEIELDFDLAD